jgi:prepilin-type N-terminal cleavage/methylation domain-containing protein
MRNKEAGFTLIEVLVSLAIVFIVFLGLSETGLVVLRTNVEMALQEESIRVAGEALDRARTIPMDNLFSSTDNVVRSFRGLTFTYNVDRAVTDLDADNRRVVVDVTWRYRGRNFSQRLDTVVRRR